MALLVAVPALAVYARSASRDLGWMDSVEFALAGATLGVPHPTGYPLYTLLVRLAAATGLGPAAGASLISALSAAAACGACAVLGLRIGFRPLAAAAGALSLAFSRELLAQATVAEVYALHLLIIVLLLLVASGLGAARDRRRSFLLLAFLFGLGLAHHLTVVLAVPALLMLGAPGWRDVSESPARTRAVMLALVLLPLALYAMLPLRSLADPVLDLGDPETPGRLLAHVTGRQFGYRLLGPESTYARAELARFGRELAGQWTHADLPIAALGLATLLARRQLRRTALALLLLAAAVLAYVVLYHIPDKGGYLLPVYFVIALFIGAGINLLISVAAPSPWGRAISAVFVLGLALAPALAHVPAADRHADRSLRDLTLEVARRTSPASLIVSDDTSLALALQYVQEVDGAFRDRDIVASYLLPLPWYAERMARIDPALPATAAAKAAARRGLKGRELGARTAADARQLAAGLARQALASREVFLYFHAFEEDRRSFEDLALADRGLVYQVVDPQTALSPPIPDAAVARRAAYEPTRRQTHEERAVARRFAAAANRAGIARVARGDFSGAEADLRQAVALAPDYAQAWFNLGVLAADYLGRREEAMRAWRKYLALAPGDPNARAVRARIARLEADSSRVSP